MIRAKTIVGVKIKENLFLGCWGEGGVIVVTNIVCDSNGDTMCNKG
jgi:hypothetical protein